MAKMFAPKGIKAEGNFLPLEEVRLFSDLTELKFREDAGKKLVEKAEKILEEELKVIPVSLFREYFIVGRRTHNGPMSLRRDNLFRLFLAEMYENKGRFVEKMVDYIWAIMEESTWMQGASYPNNSPYGKEFTVPAVFGPDRLHGLELFSPACGALLAIINYFMKDKLDAISPVVSEKILYTLNDRIVKPYLHCAFVWTGETNGGWVDNWAPWITANVLTVVALTEKNAYVRERTLKRSLITLDNFIEMYGADGGCEEGPHYWEAAAGALFDCLEILYDISGGKINLYDDDFVKLMGEYIYKVNINGTRYVNFADAGAIIYHDPHFVYRYGEKCNSKYLMSFGKKLLSIYNNDHVHFFHPYRFVRDMFTNVEPCEECLSPTDVWLPDLGIMARRESEISDKGLYLAVKAGWNNDGHNHNDTGSFIVYNNGNPVLVDPGIGEYTKQAFSADRYKIWQMQSHYHNLPAFDGVGQNAGAKYKATEVEYSKEKGSLKFELKEAYDGAAGIISYVREVGMTGNVITATEQVHLDTEREIDFRYISPVEPTLLGGNKIQLAEGRVMTYDEKLTAEIEKFGTETVKDWGPYLWRIHLKARAKDATYTVTVK